jgi:diaminopimelate epimerase
MHGARNDFAIVDCRVEPLELSAVSRWVCDRRTGVGADGLIALEPSDIADVRMRTFNADGTEAEMCGNGVRCAARWLHEAGEGDGIAFETEAGIVRTQVVAREPEYLVRVEIGTPVVEAIPLPMLAGAEYVTVGNPHVVIFRPDVEGVDLDAVAERVQHNARFRNGINVHLAAALGEKSIAVRHWERGVGLTPACGTGAVACAAVAIERGFAGSPVEVFVPGGRLVVEWSGEGGASLIGPAVRVFDAEVRLGTGALS